MRKRDANTIENDGLLFPAVAEKKPARTRKASPAAAVAASQDAKRTAYERHRDRMGDVQREQSKSGRDIGPLPPVRDPARRAKATASLRAFAETYFPERFHLDWSGDHLKIIERMERVIRDGGLYAMACPRGFGKTTIVEVAVIFAMVLGLRSYIVIIGSDEGAAEEILESIKTELENNDLLAEDFPEVCHPIRKLEMINQRAKAQILDGVPTRMQWKERLIVLPTVRNSAASGCRIQVAGLEGRIRGMKFTRSDGRVARPDLVIPDDPQTDESANSPTQTEKRERLVAGAVLGLAGPGKKIAGFLPCTVIRRDDLADRVLDRKRHPAWQGERMKMVYRWPESEQATKLWARYFELRRESVAQGGKGEEANKLYAANRAAMDDGAIVAWEANRLDDEISGLQHAMNIRCDRGERAFFAEYQNEPLPDQEAPTNELKAEDVLGKLNGLRRAEIPLEASTLTAFIDVQGKLLVWTAVAWEDNFTGYVVDYGTFPDQKSTEWTRDPKYPLSRAFPKAGEEAQLVQGLGALCKSLLSREFARADGSTMRVQRCLVDASGSRSEIVKPFCRSSEWGNVLMPSHGRYVGPTQRQFSEYVKKRGEKVGLRWRIPVGTGKSGVRHVLFDSNWWKSFVHARFRTELGDPGAISLWGRTPDVHSMFAQHMLAERPTIQESRGVAVEVWNELPGRENDLFDCMVGAAVAASMLGVRAPGLEEATVRRGRRRVTIEELRARAAS